ncbi:hypothetical protein DFH27DRAFT_250101 [Peziza echinospora]|nr:hypothetical protein DFH27DRAFT_250101 [Peziza echinospora]
MGAGESRLFSEQYHVPIQPSTSYNPKDLNRDETAPLPQGYIIDFSTSPLSKSYTNHYALVIDNCFTPAECAQLISLAESSAPWAPAMINSGPNGEGVLAVDYRNSGRILVDDKDAAAFVYERVKPWLDEVEVVGPGRFKWKEIVEIPWGSKKRKGAEEENWKMTRINERLRFLKYGPGQEFKKHCDSSFTTKLIDPDAPEELSFLTLQAYLADTPDLKGGATTLCGRAYREEEGVEVDVRAMAGRVLIFQQADILHSGQLVKSGEKVTVRSDIMYKVITSAEEVGSSKGEGAEVEVQSVVGGDR